VRRSGARLLAVLAVLVAGCGDTEETDRGGVVLGQTLTVYSVLPDDPSSAGTAQDLIDGEKLALAQAGGRSGSYLVNFATLRFEEDADAIADVVRQAMRDPAVMAVIGDLDSRSARVSVPLLNAGGVLHLSPGATYTGFVAPAPGTGEDEPDRWTPSGQRTFAPLAPTDVVQARALAAAATGDAVAVEAEAGEAALALAQAVRQQLARRLTGAGPASTVIYVGDDPDDALGVIEALGREAPRARVVLPEALLRTDLAARLPRSARRRVVFVASVGPVEADTAFTRAFGEAFGREPGPYAKTGFEAMKAVLAAIRRAGGGAGKRSRVIAEYFATKPLRRLATAPWYQVRVGSDGDLRFTAQ
jgi:ABC-type branched-subunit amino acid transport system substrate-binding protein